MFQPSTWGQSGQIILPLIKCLSRNNFIKHSVIQLRRCSFSHSVLSVGVSRLLPQLSCCSHTEICLIFVFSLPSFKNLQFFPHVRSLVGLCPTLRRSLVVVLNTNWVKAWFLFVLGFWLFLLLQEHLFLNPASNSGWDWEWGFDSATLKHLSGGPVFLKMHQVILWQNFSFPFSQSGQLNSFPWAWCSRHRAWQWR